MLTPQKIEIMSPAGSYEALMAAIQAGAGSVYFGIGVLNMRARSSVNFTLDDLVNITEICSKNKVKSYLTVNTVIYDNELKDIFTLLEKAKECNITAIIASDIAVISYCRKIGLEIHISTQCNITNIEAVKFYSQFADVLVLARELSLNQVEQIHKSIVEENICGPNGELVKIEMFIHGALCMAVSGKCYISLDNYNYSANRGACLQPCRRGYYVNDIENEIDLNIDNQYIMSPKDLCTIDFLDKLIKAGVSILKIEGRGRSPEYVKITTKCYHEAVEAIIDGNYSEEKALKWKNELETVYNRGFWEGYYLGKKMGEWSDKYGSNAKKIKKYAGKVTNYFSKLNVAEIFIETKELNIGDEILIIGTTTGVEETVINEIRVDLASTEKAVKGEYCSIRTPNLVRRGDKVYIWEKSELDT